MDKRELRYLVDDTPQVLPTFGNVAQSFHMTEPPSVKFPGIDIELSRVLHASEAVIGACADPTVGNRLRRHQVHRHLGQGQSRGDLVGDDCHHAGRHTAVDTEAVDLRARRGRVRRRARTVDVVGAAGARPDFELSIPVSPQQALLYRMCGDRNPLHSDPEFAAAAGFPRPILHGLCTYGMTCKAMVDALLDGDTSRVGSYGARFAGVVFPGETLKVNIWKEGDGFRAVVTAPESRGRGRAGGRRVCACVTPRSKSSRRLT